MLRRVLVAYLALIVHAAPAAGRTPRTAAAEEPRALQASDASEGPSSDPIAECSGRRSWQKFPAEGDVFYSDPQVWYERSNAAYAASNASYFYTTGERVAFSVGTCVTDEGQISQLVGPFTSYGNYDWWQTRWHVPVSTLVGTDAVMTGYSQTAVSHTGDELGYPPLHNHHSTAYNTKTWNVTNPYFDPITSEVLEGAFDYISPGADDLCSASPQHVPNANEQRCLRRTLGGFGKTLPETLYTNVYYDDVRTAPANGTLPPLTWYAHLTLSTAPREGKRIVSEVQLYNVIDPTSRFATYDAPVDRDAFTMQTAPWLANGTVLVNVSYHHAHQGLHQMSFLLMGAPADIGLGAEPFHASSSTTPIETATAGFANNAEMIASLLRSSAFNRALLCSANSTTANVDGVLYDRASIFECVRPTLRLRADQPLTQITFSGPKPTASGVVDVNEPGPGGVAIGAAQHSVWYMRFLADDGDLTQRAQPMPIYTGMAMGGPQAGRGARGAPPKL